MVDENLILKYCYWSSRDSLCGARAHAWYVLRNTLQHAVPFEQGLFYVHMLPQDGAFAPLAL